MTNHPADRHVVAAAVRAHAHQIVTVNLRDFPQESLEPYRIQVVTPDTFLLGLLDSSPERIVKLLRRPAAETYRTPLSLDRVLANVSRHAPRFIERARVLLSNQEP